MDLILKPFYIIRHGETDWNKQHRIMGQNDIPLNANGIEQAHAAQLKVRGIKIEKLFVSPLMRTRVTAEILNLSLAKNITFVDDLKERRWGDIYDIENFLFGLDETKNPSEAEPYEEFTQRVLRGVNVALAESKESPLIVAHGAVIAALARHLSGEQIQAHNCSLFYFEPVIGVNTHKFKVTQILADN